MAFVPCLLYAGFRAWDAKRTPRPQTSFISTSPRLCLRQLQVWFPAAQPRASRFIKKICDVCDNINKLLASMKGPFLLLVLVLVQHRLFVLAVPHSIRLAKPAPATRTTGSWVKAVEEPIPRATATPWPNQVPMSVRHIDVQPRTVQQFQVQLRQQLEVS